MGHHSLIAFTALYFTTLALAYKSLNKKIANAKQAHDASVKTAKSNFVQEWLAAKGAADQREQEIWEEMMSCLEEHGCPIGPAFPGLP